MTKMLVAAFYAGVMLAASAALAQQAPVTSGLPAVHHLVYRFGYNTQATNAGTGTGTTTIDIVGLANDGGMTVTATDHWWNTVKPRQTYSCEVYPNGGVTCAKPPYALSPIQVAIVPLLGQKYFSALAASSTAHWTQSYNVRATFFPGAAMGFAGQVYTWNCTSSLVAKGPASSGSPVVLIQTSGTMKQHGGRYIVTDQQGSVLFDPHLQMPVLVNDALTFVPPQSINRYTVQLKLIQYSAQ